jgi:hypothetical protein
MSPAKGVFNSWKEAASDEATAVAIFRISVGCLRDARGTNAGNREGASAYQLDQQLKEKMGTKTPTIKYHGGSIIPGANLYVVYYGNFTWTQHDILDTFLQNIGGSPAFNVNTEYYDSQGQYVRNVLNYDPEADSYNDAYSLGKSLRGNFDTTLLHNAVSGGHLPADINGLYLLTVSPDVKLPNVWCAYPYNSNAIVTVKYAVAADPPASVLSSCSGNITNYHDKTSPNGDVGMDEVVDSLMHEHSETVTDPGINAWFTSVGSESKDLCNFVYGTTLYSAEWLARQSHVRLAQLSRAGDFVHGKSGGLRVEPRTLLFSN